MQNMYTLELWEYGSIVQAWAHLLPPAQQIYTYTEQLILRKNWGLSMCLLHNEG